MRRGSAASVFEHFGGGVQSLAEPVDDGWFDTIDRETFAQRLQNLGDDRDIDHGLQP
jgi:hypothetical protein